MEYLRSIEDFQLDPMTAIRAQTEAIGDPNLPKPEQVATLEWLQKAYSLWADEFPIEEPLASQIRALLPVAAAAAVTDESFFIPGSHPVHLLLEAIHNSAIGWQTTLGRASLALPQLVAKIVEETDHWFRRGRGDLAAICTDMIAKAEQDQDRAKRMTRRLVDTEIGRLRSASARWKAAEMINRVTQEQQATTGVGNFLRGPWYESAQLVLLKFGADSPEWAQMSAFTEFLMSSLQVDKSAGEEGRQLLFERVTKTPKELKRWLLSLNMDPEALSDAVGLVEHAHLRLLRGQALELEPFRPLAMEGMMEDRTAGTKLATIEALELGQWFIVKQAGGEELRAQLIFKLNQEQQLLFANKAGMKTLELSYEAFCSMQAAGKITPLRVGASFSICLALALGIETVPQLEALIEREMPELVEQARLASQKLAREREDKAQREKSEREQQLKQEHFRLQKEKLMAEEQRELLDALQDEGEQRALEEALQAQREQEEALQLEQKQPEVEINLPMGTWLGFHDSSTPLMAKLAVHDRQQDSYIFVNRDGARMRALNKEELLNLIECDLVEILEANSNFKDAVKQAKNNHSTA